MYTPVEIANFAYSDLGGAGDQTTATGQITSLADTDAASVWANKMWERGRTKVLCDLARLDSPIAASVRHRELDDELVSDDVAIESITVGAGPGFQVTVVTQDAHEKTTGDTVVLKDIDGDGNISEGLNDETYTITVVDTTTFTLDSTTGVSTWDHTADTGVVSRAPALGLWTYAFNWPSNCLQPYRVTDQDWNGIEDTRHKYRFDTLRNRDNNGNLIVTNDLTNSDADGIYLAYIIDVVPATENTDTVFHHLVDDAIAKIMAHYLAPIMGRNTEIAAFFKKQYTRDALPAALGAVASKKETLAKPRKDYRGGRAATLPRSL